MALYKINKLIMNNELFNCCGKKNQLIKTINNPAMLMNKYFFKNAFLLLIKKAARACVGQAHNKLKLFLHMA